jgi:hypothetical protein
VRKYLLAIACLTLSGELICCETKDTNNCRAYISDESLLSLFKAFDRTKNVTWGRVTKGKFPEYGWITETGNCTNKIFVTDGLNYSASIRNLSPQENLKTGSFKDLIKRVNHGVAHYNLPGFENKYWKMNLILEDNYLGVYSVNSELRELVISKKPKYVKMTSISPQKNNNYECISKIMYDF